MQGNYVFRLSGVYNQVLVDGLPTIQGLTYTYGTGTIPGSMLENIWVVKGANSVLQGYEGMVGQITIFPREGGTAEPFTTDVLVNNFGGKTPERCICNQSKTLDKLPCLAHFCNPAANGIGTMTVSWICLGSGVMWCTTNGGYRKENENGLSAFIGARYVNEDRVGGQKKLRS